MMPAWGCASVADCSCRSRKVANIEREDGAVFTRGVDELLVVGRRVVSRFLSPQYIKAAPAQIHRETGHDMTVEVETDKKRFKVRRIGHGLALPGR